MKNYCKQLETFIFRGEWTEIFAALTDDQAGALIKAVCEFIAGTREDPPEDPSIRALYLMLVKKLNRAAKRYAARLGLADDPE